VRKTASRIDMVAALIALTDLTERGLRGTARLMWRTLGRQSLGLTGGLIWRSLAALTGIGLTATLVTALSSQEAQPTLSTLTVAAAQDERAHETRPVRDVRQEPLQPASERAGDPWIRIPRPIALIALESPELDRQPAVYEAQRNQAGTRRLDTLVFGSFDSDKPHAQLRMLVDHGEAAVPRPFVITLVRDAAQRGMSVQRSGVPDAITTKFGPVETADATLSDGTASRQCLAFAKPRGEGPMGLAGWWCGGAGRPADRKQLACLIDRLDLVSAGDDHALRTLFSRSELARQPGCGPQHLTASGRKASWLDPDGKTPVLRASAVKTARR